MIRTMVVAFAVLVSSVTAAEPRDEVIAAATKLANSDTFTWVSWVEADGHPLMGGPTTGMVQKNGFTTISLSRNSGICIVLKGDKAVLRTPQGWVTPQEFEKLPEAQRRYNGILAEMVKKLELPPAEIRTLLRKSTNVKKTGEGSYEAELREDVARAMLAPHIPVRSRSSQVLVAEGMVTINVVDGLLKDYAVTVSARLKTDAEEREFEWLVKTVIKEVNGMKVDVPEEANRRLTAEKPE